MAQILVADDDTGGLEAWRLALIAAGHRVVTATSGAHALAAFGSSDFDVVVTDVASPGMTGIELCAGLAATRPDVPVIVMTADVALDTAIAAIRAGAFDFLRKPTPVESLLHSIDRAMRHRALAQRIVRLRKDVVHGAGLHHVLGDSAVMRQVLDVIARQADSETSVLVLGAAGTGKEIVARVLHDGSRRRAAKFLRADCSMQPESQLEEALFGVEGLLVQAQGGTLMLDEVGDLPLTLQPRLLRALHDKVIRPSGSSVDVPIDVRVIATSSKNLELAIEERRFRSDLFARISVGQIVLPTLRARGADIMLLADHFLGQFALSAAKEIHGIGAAATARLLAYEWPGNVRQLQSAIERAVGSSRHGELDLSDLPEEIGLPQWAPAMSDGEEVTGLPTLRQVTRRYVAHVLTVTEQNKTVAARVLGIDRKTLYRWLESDETDQTDDGTS
ncbi:MAG: sigma-54 dependent transcriptional regulator, partial [Polyangiales bacterium]